jgi:hypothetical protein
MDHPTSTFRLGALALIAVAFVACSGDAVVGGRLDVPGNDLAGDAIPMTADDGPAIDAPTGKDGGGDVAMGVDGADLDADVAMDVAGDAGDAAMMRCLSNADCVGTPMTPVCDLATGRCVGCLPASDMCPAGQFCDPTTNSCVSGCRNDMGCPSPPLEDGGAGPVLRCNPMTRSCEQCVTNDHCPAGMLCAGGVCTRGCNDMRPCPSGETCCAGACVNTQSNDAHCGRCSAACMTPNGEPICTMGVCGISRCTAPFANCDGVAGNGCETNALTSVNHCGGCGMRCQERRNASVSCEMGACQFRCNEGFADCNMNPDDGCEAVLGEDPRNCGTCGTTCMTAGGIGVCRMGRCDTGACGVERADCDRDPSNGCETNTGDDVRNCGGCGTVCPMRANASPVCFIERCSFRCNDGFADCDGEAANGCEVDLRSDPMRCGRCDIRCDTPNGVGSCTMGVCGIASCNAGFDNCDMSVLNGCETNLQTDTQSCGRCGTRCVTPNGTAVCAMGTCGVGACDTGYANCDMMAANGCEVLTVNDRSNCGRCGNVCPTPPSGTTVCRAGACLVSACPAGTEDCNMSAADGCEVTTTNNLTNCGGCGIRCPAIDNGTPSCTAGRCGVGACNAGFADCDRSAANGCEINTTNNLSHCGGCGVVCPSPANATRTCAAGACGFTCLPGFANCDGIASNGCEVNLNTSTTHCGACGRGCVIPNGAPVCTAGVCGVGACNAGFGNCNSVVADGCEVDVRSSTVHCGRCMNACPAGQSCAASTCACPAGTSYCASQAACRNLATDTNNCGACGRVCGAGQSCSGGSCVCPVGQTNCSGVCRTLATDAGNCGACGRACGAGQACVSGVCIGSGSLRFTLTWDRNGDMDLHVRPPCGTEIYYGARSACGGTLDRDDTSGRGPENINWVGSYTPGTYYACAEAFSSAVAAANYVLTVVRGGVTIRTVTGVRGVTDGNRACGPSFNQLIISP